MNDAQFLIHNSHLEGPADFSERDPQLRLLSRQKYQYIPDLVEELPIKIPGVYTIAGGRQIGKTTLAKQWMQHLLQQGILPQNIAYFTGEVIVDHLSMIRQLQSYINQLPPEKLSYLIIDEVTYITNWDMGIKFLADAGLLENIILVITGSDLAILSDARKRFPGRRGKADQVDFHIHPLSFYEVVKLKNRIADLDSLLAAEVPSLELVTVLDQEFKEYLIHGGYLTAINNYAVDNSIHKSVLETYADWIRGDVIKHGKSDHNCREFFNAMIKRLNSQVTWSSLAKDFAIEHHSTIADYAELLMLMDAIYVQQALIEDKLVGSPKKARKLLFTDPFIYHAIFAWLNPSKDPFIDHILPALSDSKITSNIVEACVISHYRRWYQTFYIKSDGEVDIAYVNKNKFWPIEIKWTEQLRSKDLKQIQKYKNGIILGKQKNIRDVNAIKSMPLVWYLARMAFQHKST